jgi:type I restriction enzyme S subunit
MEVMKDVKVEKYSEYKDSGEEWLGEIPKHWNLSRLGVLLTPVSTRNRLDLPLLSITREKAVILRDLENENGNHNFIPDDLSNYKVLKKGQFGMNKMKAWQGSYGISDYDGIVSPAYFIFQLKSTIVPSYFHAAIRSRLYVSFFGSASDGVRIGQWDLSKERMKQIPFLIPPIKEQTAIAQFLDRKTASIDQAIDIKEKQINLLKERRQIVIHQAVTRGLNPEVKMKDSGVEWIEEVPEHWEVLVMNYAVNAIGDVDHYMPPTIETGVPYLMTGDLEEFASDIDFDNCKKVSYRDYSNLIKKIKTSVGDVVLARYATIGTSTYVNIDMAFLVSYSCVTIKPDTSKLLGLYLFYYFKSDAFAIDIKNRINTNTQGNVGIGDLKKVKLALPPIKEQLNIIEYLQKESNKIDNAISLKQQEIKKLKEYKSTLINSAVTGKIKVS